MKARTEAASPAALRRTIAAAEFRLHSVQRVAQTCAFATVPELSFASFAPHGSAFRAFRRLAGSNRLGAIVGLAQATGNLLELLEDWRSISGGRVTATSSFSAAVRSRDSSCR